MTDEQQIRSLIEAWTTAVHDGDLDTVLADHAPEIVMFDVPPPYEGVRGMTAYRDSWLPFFEWQASGAIFELDSLDVVVGSDVAFAYGLLRCGTPADFARDPQQRLRLTIGLRKSDGSLDRASRAPLVHRHEHRSRSERVMTRATAAAPR